jgi:hypothetical protein
MPHNLEDILNAPATDIMDAILAGFRTQVDVKGKLAELYLFKRLKVLNDSGYISELIWNDKDGVPDFFFKFKGKDVKAECKNLRNEIYRTPEKSYKVEIQKTRNSKDGSNTRSYRVGYFDILAVCLFNQTGVWKFYYIRSEDLETLPEEPSLLKIMQRVPIEPQGKWKIDIKEVLG